MTKDFADGGAMLVKKYAGEHADDLKTQRQQAHKVRKEVYDAVKAVQRKRGTEEEVEVQLVTNVAEDWEKSQSGMLTNVMGYLLRGGIS